MGMPRIRVGMQGIRVAMRGIRVAMRGIGERIRAVEWNRNKKKNNLVYKIQFSFFPEFSLNVNICFII